ncbi:MAG: DEAD/DEAH box helicase [Deltaproteobacteria bacterium]|nr:DEAD/DEAH box helicase [Deltaproteobacteria bacterium]
MRKGKYFSQKTRDHWKRPAPRVRLRAEADAKLKRVFASIGIPDSKPFKPDPFQLEALEAIEQADCLVTAPTGSGKTWIAEQAIARHLEKGMKSWYASPLKALSNAKYTEFSNLFGAENVGILTGDRKENSEAPIIVGTTEILRNQLYDAMHQGMSLSADFVILDEAHFLGDEDRGVVWEEILIYLPSRIPILMLSATIGNAHEIADWLSSIRLRPCVVVEEKKRPVPLYALFLHPSGRLMPLLSYGSSRGKAKLYRKVMAYENSKRSMRLATAGKLPPFGEILRVLRKYRLLPAIFFLKSRADCDKALALCSENRQFVEDRREIIHEKIELFSSQSPYISRHHQRWELENLAVAAHHSGQLPSWKLVIENLMTQGLLDAVFATSTVAAGVNFPARSVVFLNSDRFNGSEFKPLTPTEFHQMTGRAGRRGMDRIGFAVAVPGRFMDTRFIAKLTTSPPAEVLSQIRINFSMVLNLLLSHSPEQIKELLSRSFATYLMLKEKKASIYGEDQLFLWRDFVRHLHFLQSRGFVSEKGELTDDGKWASRLRIDQPLLVAEGLREDLLPDSDPALLAAVVAIFVSDRETDDRIHNKLIPKALLSVFLSLKKGLKSLAKEMAKNRFEVRPLSIKPAATMFAWATGRAWNVVCSTFEIEQGDMAMLVLRTADNLRHLVAVSDTFPKISNTAETAIRRILRDPVVTEYES